MFFNPVDGVSTCIVARASLHLKGVQMGLLLLSYILITAVRHAPAVAHDAAKLFIALIDPAFVSQRNGTYEAAGCESDAKILRKSQTQDCKLSL